MPHNRLFWEVGAKTIPLGFQCSTIREKCCTLAGGRYKQLQMPHVMHGDDKGVPLVTGWR